MTFAGFKKQITKANQLLSEKMGNAKATELESEYLANEKRIEAYKSLFDDMTNKVGELLQPNSAYRTKLMAQNAFHKFSSKSGQKAMYPQPEGQLAEIFVKHSADIGNTLFSKTLTECGDSFKEFEELKYKLEDEVKQNFLEPVGSIRSQPLKEISLHRKKVQSRRLVYDALKRKKELGNKVTEAELEEAEARFEEAKELASNAMINFLESETEHISILGEWIKAEREYHHQAADLCESLYSKIIAKRDEAKNTVHQPRQAITSTSSSKSKTWSNEDVSTYNKSSDNTSPTAKAPFVIKKGKENPTSTATCRALFDFNAESEQELTLKQGEIVKLIEQIDENWYEGEIHGKVGFFPVSFVEVLVPLKD